MYGLVLEEVIIRDEISFICVNGVCILLSGVFFMDGFLIIYSDIGIDCVVFL